MRSPQGPQKVQGMREQISTMLQKKVITVLPPDSPGFNSNVFLVHKASGEWRPVIDFKQLNAHIFAPHFHSSVVSTVRKGDYSFKMDLQDAYFHVYQSIQMAESTYVLPLKTRYFSSEYCLNTAPRVFTRLGHTVAAYLHCQRILVIPYLNNWLIHHTDRQVLLCHQSQLLKTLGLRRPQVK